MDEIQSDNGPPVVAEVPPIWNPNAAAAWSLLFTPIFGAYLHAVNWRALGQPDRARLNMTWAWATLAFVVFAAATAFLPESKNIEGLMHGAGIGLMVGWYLTLGKSQADYVSLNLPNDYRRRSWAKPLALGVAAMAAFLGVAFLLAFSFYSPDPQELADEVKPLILQQWHGKPGLEGATIEAIKLEHEKGPVYKGTATVSQNGQIKHLPLEVDFDGETVSWKLADPDK